MPTDNYDYIYLSPHLDDAIYSCGAQIFQHTSKGKSVMIITIMAGDPDPGNLSRYARSLHERWNLRENAPEDRRNEDVAACSSVGADTIHWAYLDCIYRQDSITGISFYQSDDALFGPIDASEYGLIKSIASRISNLPAQSLVFAPLSAGNHVDHQIARQAASLVIDPSRIRYYEEYPYVIEAPDSIMGYESDFNWRSDIVTISQEALTAKIKAMLCYRSQISTFFEDDADLKTQVTKYVESVGGERIWYQRLLGEPGGV